MIGCWSAQANTDWIRQRDASAVAQIASSGDLIADYRAACQLLGIALHPKVVIRKIVDAGDDNILQVFGFSLDLGTATALSLCLPSSVRLTTLQFWNAGLTTDVVRIIAALIKRVPTIHSLHLDWNPIADQTQVFAELVGPGSPLKLLSLRGNRLTDQDLKPTVDTMSEGGQLAILNLSSNKITTASCLVLSDFLRQDRFLTSLSLSHNAITDQGLAMLLSALKPFPLNAVEAKTKKFQPRGKLPSGQVACLGNNVLKNLVCSFTDITGNGVADAVAAVADIASLTRLSLSNNCRIPQLTIAKYRSQSKILLDPPGQIPGQRLIEEPLENE